MRKQSVSAVGLLQAEADRLEARLETLKVEVGEVQSRLDRVRGALTALEAGPPSSPSAETPVAKAPKVRELGKTGLTDVEVGDLVLAALATGEKTEAELKALLLQHAKASGRLGTGVHLTLRRVLRSDRFEQVGEAYGVAHVESA